MCLDTTDQIRDFIWSHVPRDRRDNAVEDVVFVMSNGSFDGLNELLERDLTAAKG